MIVAAYSGFHNSAIAVPMAFSQPLGDKDSNDWPTTSSFAWPKMRSAPGFQKRIILSQSAAIIASELMDRTALVIKSEKLMMGVSQS